MKLRNLKRRLYGLSMLPSKVARMRYFRGHGVHSPFVYRLVRQAFMCREVMGGERALFEALCARGIPRKWAVQLQNLYTHCGYRSFSMNRLDEPCDLCLLTAEVGEAETQAMARKAAEAHTTLVLLTPYEGRDRTRMCRHMIAAHPCTSVDKGGFLLLFSDPKLPKQHYRI